MFITASPVAQQKESVKSSTNDDGAADDSTCLKNIFWPLATTFLPYSARAGPSGLYCSFLFGKGYKELWKASFKPCFE